MSDDAVKLVPVTWHNGAWHGDGTLDYTPPAGWQVRDVTNFRRGSGNENHALIVLERCAHE